MNASANNTSIKVWDPVVRIGHWLLVIGFFANYILEDEVMTLHVWIGYTLMAIVLIRILWGFIGTDRARFSDFVRSPAAVFNYLRSLFSDGTKRYLGHNPAGGIMILLLLACIFALGFSGIMLYALEENAGPLAGWVGETGAGAVWAADEHFWEETHEVLGSVMLGLVILHVLGVIVSSRVYRENLVRAMFTGRKRLTVPDPE